MSIVEYSTKTCSVCGATKPLSDYYLWASNKKPMPYCKKCHRAKSNSYTPKPPDICGIEHQNEFIHHLRSQGIYASPGKSSEYLHTDVVVWGCVRIEVKLGEARGQADPYKWIFRFTQKQVSGWLMADLIAFMCPDANGYTYYLFEPDYPAFYRADGKFKPVLSLNVKTPWRKSIQPDVLAAHRNNWHVIEQKRLEIAAVFQRKAIASVV